MKSLLDEALGQIAKDEARLEKALRIKQSGSIPKSILRRFSESFTKYPIALELILTQHNINTDDLSYEDLIVILMPLSDGGAKYYQQDIGAKTTVSLMQDEVPASRDQGATTEIMYCAWAIKFENIFGMDIYFIPYKNAKNGFACVTIDPKVDEERGNKRFFYHDIFKNFAVQAIIKHKKSLAT